MGIRYNYEIDLGLNAYTEWGLSEHLTFTTSLYAYGAWDGLFLFNFGFWDEYCFPGVGLGTGLRYYPFSGKFGYAGPYLELNQGLLLARHRSWGNLNLYSGVRSGWRFMRQKQFFEGGLQYNFAFGSMQQAELFVGYGQRMDEEADSVLANRKRTAILSFEYCHGESFEDVFWYSGLDYSLHASFQREYFFKESFSLIWGVHVSDFGYSTDFYNRDNPFISFGFSGSVRAYPSKERIVNPYLEMAIGSHFASSAYLQPKTGIRIVFTKTFLETYVSYRYHPPLGENPDADLSKFHFGISLGWIKSNKKNLPGTEEAMNYF